MRAANPESNAPKTIELSQLLKEKNLYLDGKLLTGPDRLYIELAIIAVIRMRGDGARQCLKILKEALHSSSTDAELAFALGSEYAV